MIKLITSALIVIFLLSLAGCEESGSSSNNLTKLSSLNESFNTTELSSLNGSFNTFEVDRISEFPDVQYPSDDLDESDYEPADEVVQYNVSFSEDGKIVTIETNPVSGQEITNEIDTKYYEIDQGLMAGGRFVVWIADDGLEAELTTYGSGVPVIRSERGYLYQNGNNPMELSSLNGNIFTLEVDRISELPDVQYPSDDLDESDYEPADEVAQYNVSFSEDGQNVTIETDAIIGQEIACEDESRFYELDEGLMAGGRLVVWIVNNEFGVELTTYGSGVPIIRSERGTFY